MIFKNPYLMKFLRLTNLYVRVANVVLLFGTMWVLFLAMRHFLLGMSFFWINVYLIWSSTVVLAIILFYMSGSALESIADEQLKEVELMTEHINPDEQS